MPTLLGIVRIRGSVNVSKEDQETLSRLCLNKRNSLSIFYDTPDIRGMLKKVEKYIAWGELDGATLAMLLEKRGKMRGRVKLDSESLRRLGCQSHIDLADAIMQGRLNEYIKKGLMRSFGMTPPAKGFEGEIQKPFSSGGVFGYWGKGILSLIERMV
ncbi:MAG: 50S ribosomal protein L30 [Thermoprotei archaeon]